MPVLSLPDWITEFARPGNLWCVKRLSANDTLATESHQAGAYIPKSAIFAALPSLKRMEGGNPRIPLDAFIDSHPDRRTVNAIWYNQRTRNEARVTGWGGGASALLDPDSTGALAVFVFVGADGETDAASLHVWICEGAGYDDEVVEDLVGPVEPGRWLIWRAGDGKAADLLDPKSVSMSMGSCRLAADQMPPEWLESFPSPVEIVGRTVGLRPLQSEGPDIRLMRRRDCEYELFRSIEEAFELPNIKAGFTSVEGFVERAQTLLQRRKRRAGLSLELHTREILIEEGFRSDQDFSHGSVSEASKRPDFLFPSQTAYQDPAFPVGRLRMLATKTTLRDRWRQILNEADRVSRKHLLTLQEGVSPNQFAEMQAANVQLVVPQPLMLAYPETVRPHLLSVSDFMAELRLLAVRAS